MIANVARARRRSGGRDAAAVLAPVRLYNRAPPADAGPMDDWLLRLPFTAPLSLNHRQHYMVKAKLTKQWRQAACEAAKAAGIPPCSRIRVTLIYVPRDKRRRDPINLVASLKACEDGLRDAGVVPDDTPQYVESQMPLIDLPDGKDPRLELHVQRVM